MGCIGMSLTGLARRLIGGSPRRSVAFLDDSGTSESGLLRRFIGGSPRRSVVFLGDSITRGVFSAPWVDHLAQAVRSRPINIGQDGLCAEGALHLTDEAINAKPAAVVVCVGTNDYLLRQFHVAGGQGLVGHILKSNGLESDDRREFTARAYGQTMKKILDRLVNSGLPTLVVAPPMNGEAQDSEAAQIAKEYSEELGAIVKDLQSSLDDASKARLLYIDFGVPYQQELEERRILQESQEGSRDSAEIVFKEFTPPSFANGGVQLMPNLNAAAAGRGPSPKPRGLNDAAAKQGFWLKPDLIHFNERCASLLIRALQPLLSQLLEFHSAGPAE